MSKQLEIVTTELKTFWKILKNIEKIPKVTKKYKRQMKI